MADFLSDDSSRDENGKLVALPGATPGASGKRPVQKTKPESILGETQESVGKIVKDGTAGDDDKDLHRNDVW
jgi:hypothetical protein